MIIDDFTFNSNFLSFSKHLSYNKPVAIDTKKINITTILKEHCTIYSVTDAVTYMPRNHLIFNKSTA